ncbi:MAG: hypothetical protein Q9165_003465 [Trypethelium subeluteriae]
MDSSNDSDEDKLLTIAELPFRKWKGKTVKDNSLINEWLGSQGPKVLERPSHSGIPARHGSLSLLASYATCQKSIDDPARELLVCAINARGSVRGKPDSNDTQAGQGTARDTIDDEECEQHSLSDTGQADAPSSFHGYCIPAAASTAEGSIYDVSMEHKGLFGDITKGPHDGGRDTVAAPITTTTASLSPCRLSAV